MNGPLNFFPGDPSWKICLTPEVADKVKKTVQYISDLNKSLADGSINVFSVRWLMDHQKQFLDITHSVLKDRTRAHYTLRLRAIELEVYERKVHEVNRILEWCKSIIKTGELSSIFEMSISFCYVTIVHCIFPQ